MSSNNILTSMPRLAKLYLLGLLVNIAYAIIVFSAEGSALKGLFRNDTGDLTELLSANNDNSREYILPADNFLKNGIFGYGGQPDQRRTIGLPWLIAGIKYLFGNAWFMVFISIQLLLSPLLYLLFYETGRLLLSLSKRVLLWGSLFLMVSGTCFVFVPMVMSDLPFTLFLFAGLYFSLKALSSGSLAQLFLSLSLITFAGLIRPSMILFAPVHFLLLFAFAKERNLWSIPSRRWMILGSSLLLCLSCNLPSFRNYANYGVFSSSDILGINMFEYTARNVLAREGKEKTYLEYRQEINAKEEPFARDGLRKKFAKEVISEYPATTAGYWAQAGTNHLVSPHWMNIAQVFGYYKRDMPEQRLRGSSTVKTGYYIFTTCNILLIALPFFFGLKTLFFERRLVCIALVAYIGMFILPTLLADGSGRFRLPVEAFIVFLAFERLRVLIQKATTFRILPWNSKYTGHAQRN